MISWAVAFERYSGSFQCYLREMAIEEGWGQFFIIAEYLVNFSGNVGSNVVLHLFAKNLISVQPLTHFVNTVVSADPDEEVQVQSAATLSLNNAVVAFHVPENMHEMLEESFYCSGPVLQQINDSSSNLFLAHIKKATQLCFCWLYITYKDNMNRI